MNGQSVSTTVGHSSAGFVSMNSSESVVSAAEGHFVINLCASMAPMPSVPKTLEGFETYKLYQVSKVEDGRRRYRLRLGFFSSEADAELIVNSVRNIYPAAFTGCAGSEDLRFAQSFVETHKTDHIANEGAPVVAAVRSASTQTAIMSTTHDVAELKHSSAATPATAPQNTTPAAPKIVAANAAAASIKTQVTETVQNTRPTTPKAAVTKPNPISTPRKAEVEPVQSQSEPLQQKTSEKPLSTQTPAATIAKPSASTKEPERRAQPAPKTPAATPVSQASSKELAKKQLNALTTHTIQPAPVAPKAATPLAAPQFVVGTQIPAPRIVEDYIPVLDSTVSLRPLTQAEAEDPLQPQWYVVELAFSKQPVNLDAMPKLDIFAAYSLYVISFNKDGAVHHSLRLGFFREAVSAEAVSGYLKTFFAAPNVVRVSGAEYARFAEPPAPAGADGEQAVTLTAPVNAAIADALLPPARTASVDRKPSAAPKHSDAVKQTTSSATKNHPQNKSLNTQLHEEARQIRLAATGLHKAPKPQSFLSKLIGRSLD